MCGIAGIVSAITAVPNAADVVARMTGALLHRGPDSGGVWSDVDAGVFFGHRRLAIVDLTADGQQPMLSASGRYVIVYNGEIYNFRELRAELEQAGRAFRGHSDTEVMLVAIEQWGLRQAVLRFTGMFAFAVWDREQRQLHLVRDRIGEKPLYYGRHGGALLFASELKSLFAVPGFRPGVDRDVLARFLRHNCVPGEAAILQGISKVPPGKIVSISARGGPLGDAVIDCYWSALEAHRAARPFGGTYEDATQELDRLLSRSVRRQMIADVPLGAFLSGGVDSSTVVALMQKQSTRPVRTFTIGFHEGGYNEAEYAKRVAQHLGTDHTELYVTPADALDVIPQLAQMYDEPFADSSQIPTFLVSRLARQHVTVALSGDGGDELFGGYNRYLWSQQIWRRLNRIPLPLRRAASAAILKLPARAWDRVLRPLMPVVPQRFRYPMPGSRLHKLARSFAVESPQALYRRLISHWTDPGSIVLGGREPRATADESVWSDPGEFVRKMMVSDLLGYLPDDILVKLDRAAMSVSLEGRVPLLDHELIEFSFGLPLDYLLRDGSGKLVLKSVLHRYVPPPLVERPKAGFALPVADWLRGPLRDWAEALLDARRLRDEGYFAVEPVRAAWEQHLSGQGQLEYLIWDVLMFQSWLEHFKEQVAPSLASDLLPCVRVA
jgi:asparagine synthase (glutamine-hydrolysing)